MSRGNAQISNITGLLKYLRKCDNNDENPLRFDKPKTGQKFGNTMMGVKIEYNGKKYLLKFSGKICISKSIVEPKDSDKSYNPYIECSAEDNEDLLEVIRLLDKFWQLGVFDLIKTGVLEPKRKKDKNDFDLNESCGGYDINQIYKDKYSDDPKIDAELRGQDRPYPICRFTLPFDKNGKLRFKLFEGLSKKKRKLVQSFNIINDEGDDEEVELCNKNICKYLTRKSEIVCIITYFGPMITNFGLSFKGRIWSDMRVKLGDSSADDSELLDAYDEEDDGENNKEEEKDVEKPNSNNSNVVEKEEEEEEEHDDLDDFIE